MQLMPNTGKQTAKQIKVKLTRTHDLMRADKNIPIGTAYMKQMLDRFDGNLAMAAGAYNAGPHRVESWQPKEACLPAEIWVEMVPFTETRRYIRRALFYSAIYEWRLNQDVLPLESKLVAIPASGTGQKKMGCSFKQPNVYGML
jgi:soluble lytic murein transglycosylase